MMPGQPIPQDIVDALVIHMIRRRWQIAGWTVIAAVRAGKLLQGIRYRYALRRAARLRLRIERMWLVRARRIRAHKRAIVIQRFARGKQAYTRLKRALRAASILQAHALGRHPHISSNTLI